MRYKNDNVKFVITSSGVRGFEGSGGVREISSSSAVGPSTPHTKKISHDFYVSHGPHWTAQGGPDPRTPWPATPLIIRLLFFQAQNAPKSVFRDPAGEAYTAPDP